METMVVPATIRETIDGRRYLTYTEEIGRSSSETEKEEFKGVLSSPRALFFALERGGGGGLAKRNAIFLSPRYENGL